VAVAGHREAVLLLRQHRAVLVAAVPLHLAIRQEHQALLVREMRVEILLAHLEIMVLAVAAVHLRLVETVGQMAVLVVQVRHLQFQAHL
jgi:hypothetical protein